MSVPEITPYAYGQDKEFQGILYRYKGAEHIATEVGPEEMVIKYSTELRPEELRDIYEDIFASKAVVEPFASDDDFKDYEKRSQTTVLATFSFGPKGVILVRNEALELTWLENDQIFEDRPEETPKVNLWKTGSTININYQDLITESASPAVKYDLVRSLGSLVILI